MTLKCDKAIRHRAKLLSAMYVPAQQRSSSAPFNLGFTLVELLVVVAVLGVLASMAIPSYSQYVTKAKTSRCISDIRTLSQDISAWYMDKGTYPAAYTLIPGREGLKDGWERDYEYSIVPVLEDCGGIALLNTDFDLYSKGADGISAPDGGANCTDDVTRSNDGSFVGLRP